MKFISTFVLVLAVLMPALTLIAPSPAHAQAIKSDITALADKSFSDKAEAVERLAATGDPRVVPALQAFLDRRLYVRKSDGKVVIGEPKGKVVLIKDPLTLDEIEQAPKRSVKRIRINNRLRGTVRAALGGLTLLSPDPDVRLQAAKAVFKGHDGRNGAAAGNRPGAGNGRRRATGDGNHPRGHAVSPIRKTPTSASKLSRCYLGPPPRTSGRWLAICYRPTATEHPRNPMNRSVARPQETLEAIEDRLKLMGVVTNIFQGLSLGSVLLLAAVGLAITFGVMGVINMAHGEMVMIGAYTTFVVQQQFRAYAPDLFDYSLLVAIPSAFLVAGLIGIAIERGIIRFLYGRPLETLLATWGLSLVLQQLTRTIFGPTNQDVGNPSWMSGAIEITGGLTLTYNRIWIIVFSLLVLGLSDAAHAQDLLRAAHAGGNPEPPHGRFHGYPNRRRIDALTFGLGSGIAGMAGVALSQIDNVSPNLGQAYIIDSFMVVVFGGVGNLWGTFVGAFSLGLVNKFLEPYAGAVLAKILVLVAIILFIQKRPRGLFALKGRAVDS